MNKRDKIAELREELEFYKEVLAHKDETIKHLLKLSELLASKV